MIKRETKWGNLRSRGLNSYYNEYRNLTSLPHSHDFFQMEYIISGNGETYVDGQRFPFKGGMLFLLSPASIHSVQATDVHLVTVGFSENVCNPSLLYQLNHERPSIVINVNPKEQNLMKELFLELATNFTNETYGHILLETIQTKLSNIFFLNDAYHQINTPIAKAVLYVISHFQNEISLTDVANYVNLTPTYFSSLFKKEIGHSFKQYLDDLRFHYACKLLLYSDFSVKEICSQSGFANYENFVRRFTERYGLSPIKYKKSSTQESNYQDIPE